MTNGSHKARALNEVSKLIQILLNRSYPSLRGDSKLLLQPPRRLQSVCGVHISMVRLWKHLSNVFQLVRDVILRGLWRRLCPLIKLQCLTPTGFYWVVFYMHCQSSVFIVLIDHLQVFSEILLTFVTWNGLNEL